ncbi:ribbon-helix-helix protein, CopG family [uncultured Sphingomonas sp.]|jgi:predicted transcriptional regulator|uniref:ribbon-helix-helix protein, CopG family n=1 Tax=uncultured Sphingomonas sp. TaxID=158754 RepID=UPI001F52CB51|nr:ribbon-helix-helix protein, CopG family [uncultured Sphingomonas sp.]MCI1142362.1 ribbon-helix-helix protein, CopG family [Sphingomonas sp. WKB10]
MTDKKAMTLTLSEREMAALEKLAAEKSSSKTAIIKQAIRLYQSMSERVDEGSKVYVEDPITKDKAEWMVL